MAATDRASDGLAVAPTARYGAGRSLRVKNASVCFVVAVRRPAAAGGIWSPAWFWRHGGSPRRPRRLVPANGKFVEIDGNRIHYVETGEGRPIVFVHGLGAQLHHFRHTLFDRFGPGYRLIALDRPGSGYSVRASGATAGCRSRRNWCGASSRRLGWNGRCSSAIRLAAHRADLGARTSRDDLGHRLARAVDAIWKPGCAKNSTCSMFLHACCAGSWPIRWRYR